MANTYITMQEVAEDLLIDFQNSLLVTATTWRGYEDDITNAHTDTGGSVKVRKPVRYNVGTGATITGTTSTVEKEVTLTVDQRRFVEANFTTQDLTLSAKDQFRKRFITPMGRDLANTVDNYNAALMGADLNYFLGTAGSAPAEYKDAALTNSFMDQLGIRAADRWLGYGTDTYAELISEGTLQNSFDLQLNKDVTRRGQLGQIADFQSYKTIFAPKQIAGIGDIAATPTAGFVSAGNVKTTVTSGNTIIVENLGVSSTGVFNPNDKIKIAGYYSVNPITGDSTGKLIQFTITNAVPVDSDGSAEATITVSPAIISAATDPYRNVSGSVGILGGAGSAISLASANSGVGSTTLLPYEINLAYVPEAVLFAAPPLMIPNSVVPKAAGLATDPETKISIRVLETYDGINDKIITRADILFGTQVLSDRIVGLLG
jgi:hypothetical protein